MGGGTPLSFAYGKEWGRHQDCEGRYLFLRRGECIWIGGQRGAFNLPEHFSWIVRKAIAPLLVGPVAVPLFYQKDRGNHWHLKNCPSCLSSASPAFQECSRSPLPFLHSPAIRPHLQSPWQAGEAFGVVTCQRFKECNVGGGL